jgi:hypothetical protein
MIVGGVALVGTAVIAVLVVMFYRWYDAEPAVGNKEDVLAAMPQAPATNVNPYLAKSTVNETKKVAAGDEWSRELVALKAGTVSLEITSEGPFSVVVTTGQAYKTARSGSKREHLKQGDVLFSVESKESTFKGNATVPAGSSYILITNRANKAASIHLRCAPVG